MHSVKVQSLKSSASRTTLLLAPSVHPVHPKVSREVYFKYRPNVTQSITPGRHWTQSSD